MSQSVPELRTPRLQLRGWRLEDVGPMATINADPRVGAWLGGVRTPPQTQQSIQNWIEHWEERGFGLWAVEERASGAFIGRIGLVYHDDWTASAYDAEVGWTLAFDAWGRGYATEGALASLRWGFGAPGLERIISITLPDNRRSRRVMERIGLELAGETDWKGLHHVWYATDRARWKDPQAQGPATKQ